MMDSWQLSTTPLSKLWYDIDDINADRQAKATHTKELDQFKEVLHIFLDPH